MVQTFSLSFLKQYRYYKWTQYNNSYGPKMPDLKAIIFVVLFCIPMWTAGTRHTCTACSHIVQASLYASNLCAVIKSWHESVLHIGLQPMKPPKHLSQQCLTYTWIVASVLGWLRCVISDPQPYLFVNSPMMKEYTEHSNICYETFTTCMSILIRLTDWRFSLLSFFGLHL